MQLPQWSVVKGGSMSSGRSVKMLPMTNQEPTPGRSSMVFLPIQPSPARSASSRSGTGPVST